MAEKVQERFVVKHEGGDYDITRFLKFHPGGTNLLAPFKNLDVGNKLAEYQHPTEAMYLMKDYKLDNTKKPSTEPEDLEHLVDWNKPMLWQVGKLGDKYYDWVTSPVDRKLRIFESDFLEMFTKTPWYVVPMVWLPAIAALLYHGYYYQNPNGISLLTVAAVLLLTHFAWYFIEYVIHRWVYHRKPSLSSPLQITIHFIGHGNHHKVPYDGGRLVLPPTVTFVFVSVFYCFLWCVLPTWMVSIFMSGILAQYVRYDLTHYYLHYGSPDPDSPLYKMKRTHNKHHFMQQDIGFGVTTLVWDRVFGTEIFLSKLKQALKW